jgi:hypothetical protein
VLTTEAIDLLLTASKLLLHRERHLERCWRERFDEQFR